MAEDAIAPWSVEARALIDALLNQIIPASADGKMPAAGDLGIADFVAARLAEDSSLRRLVAEALPRAAEIGATDPTAAARVAAEQPDFFATIQRLAYMGYYSRPDVRAVLGLSPKPVHPDGYDVPAEPEALLADLTAPVRARGKCYRDA